MKDEQKQNRHDLLRTDRVTNTQNSASTAVLFDFFLTEWLPLIESSNWVVSEGDGLFDNIVLPASAVAGRLQLQTTNLKL